MTSGGGKGVRMTPDEYRGLVDFLGKKFDRIDERFEQVDGEIRGVRVLVEENAPEIRRVADGVTTNGERLERFQAEVRQEFADVRQEMKWGFDAIHSRVDGVEDALTQVRGTGG